MSNKTILVLVNEWTTHLASWQIPGRFRCVGGPHGIRAGRDGPFQAAIYANYATTRTFHNNIDGTTAPSESFAEAFPDPDGKFRDSKFVGVSLEGIYRILSPYTDPVGLAIYLEPTVGKGLWEMETRANPAEELFR